jgi:type II secretory pathway pseudopilin PulG
MKKFTKMAGVTLLEVMLVLAVAAMIIVMSVRYYQSATYSQQANSALSMIQGITAAADGMSQGTGTYDTVDTATVQALMPNNTMTTPWGTAITVTNGAGQTYDVNLPATPDAICTQLANRLTGSTKYTSISACGAGGGTADFTYTYSNAS